MQTLNAALLPWLIAEFGIDFASLDNHEVATEMITHIITKHELGGYTSLHVKHISSNRRRTWHAADCLFQICSSPTR